MKNCSLLLVFVLHGLFLFAQPGKYAGSMKGFIGKEFTDSRAIEGLSGWTYIEGHVLTPMHNPEMITAVVFKKGNTFIVLFNVNEDTASDKFVIADVLEVKAVAKGWAIKSGMCRQNKVENSWLVAWVKETATEFSTMIKKAWRFNPDKRRIEIIPVKGIDCINVVS